MLNTAGWGVPDALVLCATSASKAGLAAGSVSSAARERTAKSLCGATPWWSPLTGYWLYRMVYKPAFNCCPRRSCAAAAKRITPSSAPCGMDRVTASSVDLGPDDTDLLNHTSQ